VPHLAAAVLKIHDISIISNLKKIIGIVVQVWHICGEEGR
jgi:hypothetical protein